MKARSLVILAMLVGLTGCVASDETEARSTSTSSVAVAPLDDEPTAVASDAAVWVELAAWPLERRSDFSAVWTGKSLIVWGGLLEDTPRAFDDGARYDPATDEWTTLPESPLSARSRHVGVWTGTEVIFWGGIEGDGDEFPAPIDGGAAYHPELDEWRPLANGPLDGGVPSAGVWTGTEVMFVGPTADVVASYDPRTDMWTELAPRPDQDHPAHWTSAHWTGSELLVVASDSHEVTIAGYDPGSETWRALPPWPFDTLDMPVTPGSPTHHWDGDKLWLWTSAPQDTGIAGFDPRTEQWTISPPFPGQDCSDTPSGLVLDDGLLGDSCGVTAVLRDGQWAEIPAMPRLSPKHPGPGPIWTGEEVLLFDAGIHPQAINFPGGAPPRFWSYSP